MFCSLGGNAPPYIILAISITILASIAASYKQYKDFAVDIHNIKLFNIIKLSTFLTSFLVMANILIITAIFNIFCDHESILKISHLITKICLSYCAFCFCYTVAQFSCRFKEELADITE